MDRWADVALLGYEQHRIQTLLCNRVSGELSFLLNIRLSNHEAISNTLLRS